MQRVDDDENLTEPEIDEEDLADQELFGETSDVDGQDDDDDLNIVRPELIQKVVNALLADAERSDGHLKRADVDRSYLRRELTISERLEVEATLLGHGIGIIEFEDAGSERNQVNGVPGRKYLTHDEEKALGRAIQLANRLVEQGGSSDPHHDRRVLRDADRARERFVRSNVRYVWKLVREKGRRIHLTSDDLFQEGMIGLLRATDLYDPEMGFRFSTYATWWIEQRMHRALADGDRTVRLPVHLHEKYRRIRRSAVKLSLSMGREPTAEELAESVGMDPVRLAKLVWRIRATECLEGDAPVGEGIPLMELVPDRQCPSAYDTAEAQSTKELITALLHTLTPREERVLRMRFGIGLGKDHTLQEVGDQFSVTRERIRQIEAKALRKLKHPSRSKRLRPLID